MFKPFRIMLKKSKILSKNPIALSFLITVASGIIKRDSKKFASIKRDMDTMLRLAKAWANGKYRNVSVSSILIIISAIIYLVNPVDRLIEFIPVIGATADLAVLGFAISRVKMELHKFEDWESEVTIK